MSETITAFDVSEAQYSIARQTMNLRISKDGKLQQLFEREYWCNPKDPTAPRLLRTNQEWRDVPTEGGVVGQ